ncbi:MAG: class I SAM-dependent methyltransferase [Chitinophagales bacterium]
MNLIEYYQRRASTYDNLYHRGERKEALDEAAAILQKFFSGKNVLEIACGTGYWTERIAQTAKSIFATDINNAMLDIAKARSYQNDNVTFSSGDFYNLKPEKKFESLFAGFIWSHIPLQELDEFIALMISYVQSNGTLVFIDNNFVEGSSTPIVRTDEFGNTYQERKLEDEETFTIIKNFPQEKFLREKLEGKVNAINFTLLKYYWILAFQKP